MVVHAKAVTARLGRAAFLALALAGGARAAAPAVLAALGLALIFRPEWLN